MKNDRRLRRLVVDGTTWHWAVRQRIRPRYEDCRLTLTFFHDGSGRRLVLVFAPDDERIISNCSFESGTVVRLSDRDWLNLYEPGTARRLLEAAGWSGGRSARVDGWPYAEALMAVTDYGARRASV
ncbi:hypothetical protein ABZ135_29585 [Streptomyces sp. NPDC006339]|uniref:hypothetical protein n=1 Tax=Streptomyces sp. NPDC006339 TaxID=3156755 RepID=UPI0033B15D35